ALDAGFGSGRKTVDAAIGGNDVRIAVAFGDFVALDPGAVVTLGHAIFVGASLHAISAADALVDVDDHAPPVVGHTVGLGGGFGAGDLRQSGAGTGKQQELASGLEHVAAGDFHSPSEVRIG